MTSSPIGFPAQPRHDLMGRLIADLRRRSDTAREETVTGLRADPARALNGKVAEMLGFRQSLDEIAQYREIIGLAESRAAAIQGSLESLRRFAVDMHVHGQTALDSGLRTTGEAVSASARQALGAAIAALNVSFGGRHLFSGDAGDGPAMVPLEVMMSASVAILQAGPTGGAAYANLAVEFTLSGGLYDTAFYTGGDGDAPETEIDRGERLGFAPRADAAPVRKLLRDLAALATAYDRSNTIPEEEREAVAAHAIAGLRGNVEALAGMAAQVGVAEERMDAVKTRHNAADAALTLAFNKLAGRDQFEAAAELTALEAQLETTYLATARLASLSLANFLR
jgi:flagellar hook-associated protein 3 FlgL